MDTYDFSSSYITFRIDLREKAGRTLSHQPPSPVNNARLQVDCVCTITDGRDNRRRVYALTASCKSEVVGAERGLWTMPNADMCMVACDEEFMIVKNWARRDMGVMLVPESLGPQPERHSDLVEDVFTRFAIGLCPAEGRVLRDIDDIVDTTLANRRINGRIKYRDGDYGVCIDHPVKTINVNEVDKSYQTDTGPVLLPDLSEERRSSSERFVEVLDHAFSAFNCADWAEFIINVPTPVSDGVSVNHYSRGRRIEETDNTLMEVGRAGSPAAR